MRRDGIAQVAVAALIGALLVALAIGWRNCAKTGGHYVRGVIWMECIR